MRNIWRGAIGVLAFCFILFSGTAVMAATDAQVDAAVAGGQAFLKAQQTPATYGPGGAYTGGGYWTDSYESSHVLFATAAAVAALLETGVPRTDQHIIDGINYIKSQVQGNGGIYSQSYDTTYQTGMAIMALALYNDPSPAVKTIVENAMNYLAGYQTVDVNNEYYGGWGYDPGNKNDWADMSNTQFAVMGMFYGSGYRGIAVAGQAWVAPLLKFIQRCSGWSNPPGENWNDRAWAAGRHTLGTDGAFSYYEGEASFYPGGPMTGSGIWSSFMIGHETDAMVAKAVAWFGGAAYNAWTNTIGYGNMNSYYYFIFAMAKGLAAAVGTNTLINGHNWVQDLKNELVDNKMQTAAGRDVQNYWDGNHYLDPGKQICTAWVLMALSFANPNTPSPNKRIADDLDNPIKGTVTLSTQNGVLIAGAIRQPIANAQKGITVKLPIGAMSFTLLNMRVGGCTDLRIDVPDGALDWHNEDSFINPNGTIKAGLSWFKVQAGAWKGNASIPIQIVFNVPGDPSKGGYILVTLCDGAPYDEDLSLNGQYKDPGAPGVGGNPPDEPTNVPGVSTGAGSGCFIKTVGGVPTAGGFMALALVLLLGLAVYIRRR